MPQILRTVAFVHSAQRSKMRSTPNFDIYTQFMDSEPNAYSSRSQSTLHASRGNMAGQHSGKDTQGFAMLVIAFITILATFFSNTCSRRLSSASPRYRDFRNDILRGRRLSNFDSHSTISNSHKADDIFAVPYSFSVANHLKGGVTGEVDGSSASPWQLRANNGNASGRRLSDSSSEGSDASSSASSKSVSYQAETLVDELCQELGAGGDNLFAALLRLEREENLEVSGGVPEIEEHQVGDFAAETVNCEGAENSSAGGVDGFSPVAQLDSTVADLLNPDFLPAGTLEFDASGEMSKQIDLLWGSAMEGIFTDLQPEESEAAAVGSSPEPPTAEDSDSLQTTAGRQYAGLLQIYENAACKALQLPICCSPSVVAELPQLPEQQSSDIREVEMSSFVASTPIVASDEGPISFVSHEVVIPSGSPLPDKRSDDLFVDAEAVRLCASALTNKPKLPSEADLRAVYSNLKPWTLETLRIASNARVPVKRFHLDMLRKFLTQPHLTATECSRALISARMLVEDMRVLPSAEAIVKMSHRHRAEFLSKAAMTLDALLWATDTFSVFTRRSGWWQTMVQKTRMDRFATFRIGSNSRYSEVGARCADVLDSLIQQRRPPAEKIAWITQFYDLHLSKGTVSFIQFGALAETAVGSIYGSSTRPEPPALESSLATTRQAPLRSSPLKAKDVRKQLQMHSLSGEETALPSTSGSSLALAVEMLVEETAESGSQRPADKGSGKGVPDHATNGVGVNTEEGLSTTLFSTALANVPLLPAQEELEAFLQQTPQWTVTPDLVGRKHNPRYGNKYVEDGIAILSRPALSVLDCKDLLLIGKNLILDCRPISHLYETTLSNKERAYAIGAMIRRLDTLLRITFLFPTITVRQEWWAFLIAKSNIEMVLRTNITCQCHFYDMIHLSTVALRDLKEQRRPSLETLAYVSQRFVAQRIFNRQRRLRVAENSEYKTQ